MRYTNRHLLTYLLKDRGPELHRQENEKSVPMVKQPHNWAK